MALGARARDVTGLVVREMALLVTAGVTVGLVLAVTVQRVAGHLVAGLETMPAGLAAAAAVFLAGWPCYPPTCQPGAPRGWIRSRRCGTVRGRADAVRQRCLLAAGCRR